MNAAQTARFNRFFDDHYPEILAAVTERDPSGAVRRTRSGFASSYRFWSKVEADGDPVGWIHRVIAEDRRSTRRGAGREPGGEPGHPEIVSSRVERHRVVALAPRTTRATARCRRASATTR